MSATNLQHVTHVTALQLSSSAVPPFRALEFRRSVLAFPMSFFGCSVDDEDQVNTAEDEVSHEICLDEEVPTDAVGAGSSAPATQPPSTGASSGAVPGSDAGEHKAQIEVADSDSESSDVWAKARHRAVSDSKIKVKPRTLDQIFGQKYDRAVASVASALLASAAATVAASSPKFKGGTPASESAGETSHLPTLATGASQTGAVCNEPKPPADVTTPKASKGNKRKNPGDDPDKTKFDRVPRGSAGTFAGRRPPKSPEKLQVFLAKKAAWDKAKEEAKLAKAKGNLVPKHTSSQTAFIAHMAKTMKENGGGKEGFCQAATTWRAHKRPAAAKEEQVASDDVPESSGEPASGSAAAAAGAPQSEGPQASSNS